MFIMHYIIISILCIIDKGVIKGVTKKTLGKNEVLFHLDMYLDQKWYIMHQISRPLTLSSTAIFAGPAYSNHTLPMIAKEAKRP